MADQAYDRLKRCIRTREVGIRMIRVRSGHRPDGPSPLVGPIRCSTEGTTPGQRRSIAAYGRCHWFHESALAHIGDSCGFRLCDGQLRQVTEDHIIGTPSPTSATGAGARTASGQAPPDRSADLGWQGLRAGNRYLLWSDGLSPVTDDRPHWDVLTFAVGPASWPPD